ncbi:MAG: histidine triad nucleotide-binding protein [Candidatus Anoxymicrobium japonicum]|uniref:Histidine triad nucleotide-binding protein n=1 Tax=Candidatus Anoxymicrobium japonicum TaxID=2013648 RepID=A0A2N3G7B2_9ACTN|nr:MAG: histidine triad nucleotide-binding protein [Candidatus Anoxymicrobium japonicum]
MAEDCLFCRIVSKEVGSDIIDERPSAIAFRDVNPQAPVHVLVVPREHVSTVADIVSGPDSREILSDVFFLIGDIVVSEGIAQSGYRIVINVGEDAGQAIDHLHFHLFGGRFMGWPPG